MTTTTTYKAFDTSKMPKSRRFMESITKELGLSGAFGSGKSRSGCEKGYFLSIKYPGNKGLVTRKTFASLRLTTMDTWFRYVMPPEVGTLNKETHVCTLKNGSEIIFLGMNDDPTRIGSLEVGWIFIDEAIEYEEEDYIMLQGRLRLPTVPFRQLFWASNPASPEHFLYKKFFLSGDPDCEVIESNSLDNPYNPSDYTENLLKLTGRYKDRYVLGKWVGFEGLVYDIVDPLEIVIQPFEVPSHWKCYCSTDFGYTNPFVHHWWRECPKEEETSTQKGFYLTHEIYMSHRTVEQHSSRIKANNDVSVLDTFADHDAEDRATLHEKGIFTTKANKEVSPGIQTVYELLGQKRIHIFSDALLEKDEVLEGQHKPTCTKEELGNYRWADKRRGRNDKEEPQDRDNHGMDAMRYFFHTLLSGPPPQHIMSKKREVDRATPERKWGNLLSRRNWRAR